MDPESDTRWERIEEIFARAHGLDHAARAALLDDACAGDTELRAQVEQLLDNYQSALNLFAQFPDLLVKVSNIRSAARTFADGELVSERFRIVRLLGQGGMGEVYEAEDLLLRDESVALKTVRASLAADAAAVKRLTNELWLARHIADPHVCRVFDVYQHTQAGVPVVFFTMELLRGDTLADRIRTGTMPTRDALSMVRQMAAAIDAAHLAHVAHGDFKPANVMIVASDAGDRLVVTDFGLARWLPLGSALLTIPDSRQWGTPAYMAPEQFFGGKVTPATDIYALGVVLYEIVTGHRPFEFAPGDVESPLELALRKLRRAPRSPREYVKDLDPRWETAILRCLDANPGKRFELASDIVKALEQPPGNARWWMAGAAALACAAAIGIPPVRSAVVEMSSPISTAAARYFGSERTIAILPFSHENRTAEGDAVSIGLSAAVTDRLATLSDGWRGLHVVPVEQVIDTGVDTLERLQQTLGATLVVTGRLAAGDGHTQVTVALNEMSREAFAVTGTRSVEIRSGDHELLEDKVAAAVSELLRVRLPSAATEDVKGGPNRSRAEQSYLLGRGYLLQGSGRLPWAITAFQQATRESAGYAAAYAGLSEAYLAHYTAMNDVESLRHAESTIDQAIALEPANPRAHVIRGRVYLTTGQHRRAIVEFQRALDIDPNTPFARNRLAAAYEAEGEIERAEEEYRAAIALHPRYWSGYEDLGTFLYRQGRYDEAEQNYVSGIGYAPANKRAIANLAAVYEIQERFLAAEGELIKGLKVSPNAVLYNNLGWIYILEGKFDAAVNALQQAVTLPLADSVIWSSLARAHRWAGHRNQEERAAYKTALERADHELRVNPLNSDVRANRAYLLAETGRGDEALREMTAALAGVNARGNVTVLFRSALIQEWVGNRKGALEALEQAARGGYPISRIARDPDLKQLRNDPGYRLVLEVAGRPANRRSYEERSQ